ncbi:hypothetical protein [Persicobacter psychrovividus]|uniref:Uncharacterized protein n=1 Tax=Persicobacter psychrovividus TaxID=387638 RepID=A0ABM7VA65_9BACT|nr:hypothetical protein PEPS_00910 [Persicobacter psychrovividus]
MEEMESLREQMTSKDTQGLLNQCKDSITSSITSQFGLASMIISNQDGGNVTTIHNANQKTAQHKRGIYAKKEDKYKRDLYDRGKNSEGKSFAGGGKNSVGAEFTRKQLDSHDNLTDAYTGKTIKGAESSPDHIKSLSQFHKDGGFMLSDEQKADFATDKGNLACTDRGVNKSMSDLDKDEWANKKSSNREITNEEHFDINRNSLNDAIDRGEQTAKNHLPSVMSSLYCRI